MLVLEDEAATEAFGARLGAMLQVGDVITLSGNLGAGKTSLARGVLHSLGFSGDVPSPSFPLIIPYAPPDVRIGVWHVDLYRIEHAEEIEELALEEALADGALLIEWPERLGAKGWKNALALRLEIAPNDTRTLTASFPPAWEHRWPV